MSEQEVKVTENVAETESAAAEAQEAEAKTYTQEQLQAEIDRVVKARLDRQKRDEDKRIEQARAEGRSEAEKLAKMTEDERRQHAEQAAQSKLRQLEEDLNKREREIAMRELKSEAIATMASKGLPKELVEVMTFSDADSCNAQIANIEKVFRAAVQTEVNAKLKASGVTLRTGGAEKNPDDMSDEEWFAAHKKH